MKKATLFSAALSACIMLAACGNGSETPSESTTAASAKAETADA